MLLKDLTTLTASLASGTLFHVEKSGKAYNIDYTKLAKAIVEEYNGSTLGGSAQSVQAAIGALNSRTGNGASFPFIANEAKAADYDDLPVGLVYNQGVGEHCPDSNGYYLVLTFKARSKFENSKCQLAFSFFTSGVVKYRAQTGGAWREWVTL